MSNSASQTSKLVDSLQKHLAEEHPDNPILAKVVNSFRRLDRVSHATGLLDRDESYATCVTWWPMISILGTFSAGKSTFINSYLNLPVQRTGNQAIDDKFTVICYSRHDETKTLPGVALDADPRFPFYQISKSIDEISEAGQQRIDAYLQLKTCPSESVRGKILIDSPGFDADEQRASTLKLTKHIFDLSDLVLVFFDARHPEPKAMQDTLSYLVSASVNRADANKFLYILNQIDVTAKEDNPEEVVSAWQRSLAEVGLITGRFYRIYNPDSAVTIEDPKVKERFEHKRNEDMADINARIKQIEVERSYRIVGKLEQTASDLKNLVMPKLTDLLADWRKKVMILDGVIFGALAIGLGFTLFSTEQASDSWNSLSEFFDRVMSGQTSSMIILVVCLLLIFGIHQGVRKFFAGRTLKKLRNEFKDDPDTGKQYEHAFLKSTSAFRPMLFKEPAGWHEVTQQSVDQVIREANDYIQELNDQFTNPSGGSGENSKV